VILPKITTLSWRPPARVLRLSGSNGPFLVPQEIPLALWLSNRRRTSAYAISRRRDRMTPFGPGAVVPLRIAGDQAAMSLIDLP
jgi:hypothetical protein